MLLPYADALCLAYAGLIPENTEYPPKMLAECVLD
ncbi:unnamed protein product, partial [marine sediment metagenome]